ncbi:MAG: ThuA domain-containing protein, partial [Opitutaceae bacterium]
MSPRTLLAAFALTLLASSPLPAAGIGYEPKPGPGAGRHIVFLSGDEEYRSEEALPMLAKILSQRHGFKCTVLFPEDPDGTINPNNNRSLAGAEALDRADAIVMGLRFRQWPDEQMKHFVAAVNRGVPIVALRTSTHAFRYPADSTSAYKSWSDKGPDSFGEKILGEEWISHWGANRRGLTHGVVEFAHRSHPVLRGVGEIFGDSGVYETHPPADATILLRGQVLSGMKPEDPPSTARKKRTSDGQEQGMNEPMMPAAWVRTLPAGEKAQRRVFTTTLGAASDFKDENLRRLVVNGVLWTMSLEIPEQTDVRLVDPFEPTNYSFNGFRKGVRASDHALGRAVPVGSVETPA